MILRKLPIWAAMTLLVAGPIAALAQPGSDRPMRDSNAYYSEGDQSGYYGRDGEYRRMSDRYESRNDGRAYYQRGRYESDCRSGNAAAGTIFGALAGGLIGSAASHGNGGAVVGGAVLGGLLGNTLSRDVDCEAQPAAFNVYASGLNGNIGRRSEWRYGSSHGTFMPTREYRRSGMVCRDFRTTSYRGSRNTSRSGTACRGSDGDWRFD